MAPIQLRRAIGLVKDKTSIGFAKAAGSADGSLEAIVVKATSHAADTPPGDIHLEELVSRTWLSRPRAYACVTSISKRLLRTRDWIVALKALIVVHRLLIHGGKTIKDEIEHATCGRFGGMLDLSGFKDEAHSDSWDYSEFVRSYAAYLGEKIGDFGEEDGSGIEIGAVKRLQGLLDRILGCRPAPGEARSDRIVIAALSMVVADSFDVYGDLCERLSDIVEGFPEMGFESSAVAVEVYVRAARQIDALFEFYSMCREIDGVGSSVSYPDVHRISEDLLKSMEEFLKAKMSATSEGEVSGSSPEEVKEKESVWMLPPPEIGGDLIDLDEHADEMALTVFSESSAEGGEDWEVALVKSASDLARQREELGGRFDRLVMSSDVYDWAKVNQKALVLPRNTPMPGWKSAAPVLALPCPEGMEGGVSEDPFAASLAVPPPSYVQMADMERKQRFLVQEEQLWRQYERDVGGGQSVMVNYGYMGKPEALYYYS